MTDRPNPKEYGLPHNEWRHYQYETLCQLEEYTDTPTVAIISSPTGCHLKGQGILLYTGEIKKVEEIRLGDLLMGMDSTPRKVINLIRGNGKMYKIIPVKGTPFIVNEDHVLTLQKTIERGKPDKKRGKKAYIRDTIVDVSVKDWLQWSKNQQHIFKLIRVPVTFSNDIELPIDPYFLGVLLGDGGLGNNVHLTTMDEVIYNELVNQAKIWGLYIRKEKTNRCGKASTYHLHYKSGAKNSLTSALEKLDIRWTTCENKFIPEIYKTSSRKDRLEILAGIIDTDGHLASGYYDYISKSEKLANDVAYICRSVGLHAHVKKCEKSSQNGTIGQYYRVGISGDISIIPCRVNRKKASERKQKKTVLRTGFSIIEVGENEYYGFEIDGDGRYLLDDFTVTHNSGKTSWPAALGRDHRVIALSETKALQEQNYGLTYGFAYLFGKGNYPCSLSDVHADRCRHARDPKGCPQYDNCAYYVKKAQAMQAQKCALNYAYFLTARWPKELAPSGFLVLDECHLLSDIVIDHASVVVTAEQQRDYELPPFPQLTNRGESFLFKDDTEALACEWLSRVRATMERTAMILELKAARDKTLLDDLNKANDLLHKVQGTHDALVSAPHDWFIRSGPRAREMANGQTAPGFVAQPLTARHHFPRQFIHGGPTILMSATVGNFNALALELGIAEYKGIVVPSQWTPEQKPIYVFDGAPNMGRSAGEVEYEKQAELIAGMIDEVPDTWSGVIHCTAIQAAHDLASRLAQRGLSGRLWVPQRGGTDKQLASWQEVKRRGSKGKLAVTWSWWTGMDLGDERICIAAKTPFPSLSSDYDRAKMQYDGKFYLQKAAWQLQQGCGRTRRGRAQDYDHDGQRAGLVAIVDGNWHRVNNYLDEDFKKSIMKWS